MAADPFYDENWSAFMDDLRRQVGMVDFADILYLRSEWYVRERRRQEPDYEPPLPPLFGEKEGKIARAHHERDPLYLFAALQRQLNYPEAPRPKARDDMGNKVETLQARLRELEKRLKLLESEVRGQVDLSQFGKPELLTDEPENLIRSASECGGRKLSLRGLRVSLCRRPATAEGAQHFVQIRRDCHFVVEEVLQPEIIVAMGHRQQRQQVAHADADGRFLPFAFIFGRQRVDAELGSHCAFLPDT